MTKPTTVAYGDTLLRAGAELITQRSRRGSRIAAPQTVLHPGLSRARRWLYRHQTSAVTTTAAVVTAISIIAGVYARTLPSLLLAMAAMIVSTLELFLAAADVFRRVPKGALVDLSEPSVVVVEATKAAIDATRGARLPGSRAVRRLLRAVDRQARLDVGRYELSHAGTRPDGFPVGTATGVKVQALHAQAASAALVAARRLAAGAVAVAWVLEAGGALGPIPRPGREPLVDRLEAAVRGARPAVEVVLTAEE